MNGLNERLFADYQNDPAFYDEMFDPVGAPRVQCRRLFDALDALPHGEVSHAGTRRARLPV